MKSFLTSTTFCFAFLFVSFFFQPAFARPLVRNVQTDSEFRRLIKYHAEETGLPVVVDFFSEGCGPCRMIAPQFKKLAKEYRDRAVFAKVDVNHNRETASRQRISSMPTFQFYLNKKKTHQFSGADINQVRYNVDSLIQQSQRDNIKITRENLMAFYKQYAPEKATDAQIEKVLEKAGGEKGGAGHRKLAEALKKKYGKPPKLVKRSQDAKSKSTSGSGGKPGKEVDLKNVPIEKLAEEIKKRHEQSPEAVADLFDCPSFDSDADEDDDEIPEDFPEWESSGYTERLVIIGAGPAGLSAAIYAARSGLRPIVVAPPEGGQLQAKGVTVENYPGLPDTTGYYVVSQMMMQAADFGTLFAYGYVTDVDFSNIESKKIYFELNGTKKEIRTQAVIIATGANARWLEVPGEDDLKGKGVSACATCDGYMFQNKDVVVIGGGDSAMEEALHLSKLSSKVTLVHRGSSFRASHILQQRVLEADNIVTKFNTVVTEFIPETYHVDDPPSEEQRLKKMKLNVSNNSIAEIETDGAFVAIGHIPNTNFLLNKIQLWESGYVKPIGHEFSTKTSVEGVFACGDVVDQHYRQAITAGGTGAMAALDAEHWFQMNRLKDEKEAAESELMAELMNEFGVRTVDDTEEECE